MPEGKVRHMYPGGNTPKGFFSYYKYIIPAHEANRIFVLKGGPGTGKSSLIRKIGQTLCEMGYDIEFMHCSSDNNALDGVTIPRIKVAVFDGTTPHEMDLVYPGAVDEIINLGDYWKSQGFFNSREKIIWLKSQIKEAFTAAYRYLKAAAILKEDTESIYEYALDRQKERNFTLELCNQLFADDCILNRMGQERKLFASAITPGGFSDYLDSIVSGYKIIRLYTPFGGRTDNILELIRNKALLYGYDIESYFCPMDPERIEHMIIPDLKVCIITANKFHDISEINNKNCFTYFINEFYNMDRVEKSSKRLDFNGTYTEILLKQAIGCILDAKNLHDELENLYIENMDFKALGKLREILLQRILSFSED
jgi:hypothetical protein